MDTYSKYSSASKQFDCTEMDIDMMLIANNYAGCVCERKFISREQVLTIFQK